jgi:hypothetical protein
VEKITRAIITDLYPLYVAGEASGDTRQLVEEFLAKDPEFARLLTEGGRSSLAVYPPPELPADHELKTLAKVKRHLGGPVWALQLALIFSALAFGRIVSDTSFDVSPRKSIITAAIALCFWLVFFVKLYRGRRSVLLRLR